MKISKAHPKHLKLSHVSAAAVSPPAPRAPTPRCGPLLGCAPDEAPRAACSVSLEPLTPPPAVCPRSFQTAQSISNPRRPACRTLYDVFCNIRDDEVSAAASYGIPSSPGPCRPACSQKAEWRPVATAKGTPPLVAGPRCLPL